MLLVFSSDLIFIPFYLQRRCVIFKKCSVDLIINLHNEVHSFLLSSQHRDPQKSFQFVRMIRQFAFTASCSHNAAAIIAARKD